MGHRGEVSLAWAQAAAPADLPAQPPAPAFWLARASLGLSVIFWLWGLAFWWRGRARHRDKRQP